MHSEPLKALSAQTLCETLTGLHARPCIKAAVTQLKDSASDINAELAKLVIAEIPAFRQSPNPDVLPELARHAPQHTDEIVRLLSGGSVADFAFVKKHAHVRAEQRFPLEFTLHAYRCGHKVFSRVLRDALLSHTKESDNAKEIVAEVADFSLEYTDTISTVFAAEYLSHTRFLTHVAGDRRSQLMNLLIDGYDETDGRVTGVLREAGYLSGRQSYCVALARSVDPAEMFNPDRARRLADAMDNALEDSRFKRLVDLRDDKATMICSKIRRTSGWTRSSDGLAAEVASALSTLGNSVLVGVSNDFPSTSSIPTAYRQAEQALQLATRGNRVVQFHEIPLQRLLLFMVGDDFNCALPTWTTEFVDANQQSNGVLVATLRSYADADMNVLQAAKLLAVHPNTVYARLQKITDLTGLDVRRFHALSNLLLISERVNGVVAD